MGHNMSRPAERCIPPTAGLPLALSDLFGRVPGADRDLASGLARAFNLPWARIECSGTAALVIALTALQRLQPARNEVIVPAYTCPLVAIAVAHCGLELRLCDLQPGRPDMDLDHLERLCGARTLAVLPTHLAGRVTDVAGAADLARRTGAFVIEDAAQALGARIGTDSVGTQGDIGFFSLAVGKGLTLYEGGVLTARDPALRASCTRASEALTRRHAGWELRRTLELVAYALCYRPALLGAVYGRPLRNALRAGDRVEAAGDLFDLRIPLHRPGRWRQSVGLRALGRLPAFIAGCTERARRRRAQLESLPGIEVLGDSPVVPDAAGTRPVLLLRVSDAARRDRLLDRLWGAGCGVGLPFAHALPDYRCYASAIPWQDASALPNARDFAARVLSLSNSPWLDDERFDRLCAALAAD